MPDEPAWTDDDLANNPHAVADKARRVEAMFAAIARSYDLNNRLHSLWRDQAWRKAAVEMAGLQPEDTVVDVACGTGDLSLAFADRLTLIGEIDDLSCHVLGIDFTFPMLQIAHRKWPGSGHCAEHVYNPGVRKIVQWARGDAMALPLPDGCCDVVSIAFGIRNVAKPQVAMSEFYRVLRPGGRVIVLEFSEPTFAPLRWFNRFYTHRVMPITATLIARDKSGAYKYLPRSVSTFLSRRAMMDMIGGAGFGEVTNKPLTFGIAVCYRGVKP